MIRIAEGDVREIELAGALDPHLFGAVDHDLGDLVIVEHVLDRPEAHDLRQDGLLQAQTIGPRERDLLLLEGEWELVGQHRADGLGRGRVQRSAQRGGESRVNARDELCLGFVAEPADAQDLRLPSFAGEGRGGVAVRRSQGIRVYDRIWKQPPGWRTKNAHLATSFNPLRLSPSPEAVVPSATRVA